MKRSGILLLTLLAVVSCGITRHAPSVKEADAPIIPPLTDAADIARSRARAQAVMDSIDLVRSGVTVPKSNEGIRTSSGVVPLPEPPRELVDELLGLTSSWTTPKPLSASPTGSVPRVPTASTARASPVTSSGNSDTTCPTTP